MQSEHARLVRREEKEENIQILIGQFLDRIGSKENPTPDECRIAIVARSPLSPVAKALYSHVRQLLLLNLRIDIAFARIEPADAYADWVELAVCDSSLSNLGTNFNLRWLKRSQLLEAHEQLTLGNTFTWWGDCMRREPENRDSFEVTSTFDSVAANRSIRAFDALWGAAEAAPLGKMGGRRGSNRQDGDLAATVDLGNVAAGELPVQGTATIATRH